MERLIEELKKTVRFKETTDKGDHVLIVSSDPQVMFYASIVSIKRDPGRPDEWWQIKMHVFSIPPQTVVWTLREPQFTGKEIFSLQGVAHFMQAVHLDDGKENLSNKNERAGSHPSVGSTKNPFRIVK